MGKISLITTLAIIALAAQPVMVAQSQSQTYPQTQQPQQTQPTQPSADQQAQPQQAQPQQSQPQAPIGQQTEPQVQPRTAQQANQQQQEVVNSTNPGEIPAGTELYIRADENITAQSADPQHTYQGTVTRQIVDSNGRVLIPKGTPVQLSVMQGSGTSGDKNLALGVNSMTINGQTYPVTSDQVTKSAGAIGGDQGIGANKRTATHVGGGAVLGTLLGAVIGGGKGAAIGAVTGAAAGGAVQVLTKGNKVNVPAETELQFHLDQPIRLQGYNGN